MLFSNDNPNGSQSIFPSGQVSDDELTSGKAPSADGLPLVNQLPPLSLLHLQQYPFAAPENVADCVLYYEGSFDPFGDHHRELLLDAMVLGFPKAVLGMVFQNPYKARRATEYEVRKTIATLVLEQANMPVLATLEEFLDPGAKGVFIPKSQLEFHFLRESALRGWRYYLLVGADNFDRAMNSNVLWTHVEDWAENPHAEERYGFRSLYTNDVSFARRVMVPPKLYQIHSTQIRSGEVALPTAAQCFAQDNKLYCYAEGDTSTEFTVTTSLKPPVTIERTTEELLHAERCLGDMKAGLAEAGLFNNRVEGALRSLLSRFDLSQFAELSLGLSGTSPNSNPFSVIDLPALEIFQEIRATVIDSMLRTSPFTTGGGEVVADSLAKGKRIVFVGNHSGWADALMLCLALRSENVGACANRLAYIGSPIAFRSQFTATVFGRSLRQISLPSNKGNRHEGERILKLLRPSCSDIVIVFPENTADRHMTSFRSEAFSFLLEKDRDWGDVIIIPWSQIGGQSLAAGLGLKSDYFKVNFGAPLNTIELAAIAKKHGVGVVAHFVGRAVASLLPPELRGVYCPPALLPDFSLGAKTLEDIKMSFKLWESHESGKKLR